MRAAMPDALELETCKEIKFFKQEFFYFLADTSTSRLTEKVSILGLQDR